MNGGGRHVLNEAEHVLNDAGHILNEASHVLNCGGHVLKGAATSGTGRPGSSRCLTLDQTMHDA